MKAIRFFVLMLLAASWPAGAQFIESFAIEPRVPVDTMATRVGFEVNLELAGASHRPRVVREGQTIRITTDFGLGCVLGAPCGFPMVLVTADLGVLPAGTYEVELWIDNPHPEDSDQHAALVRTQTLVVAPGPRLSFSPPHPFAGQTVSLRIDGLFGRCPRAEAPTVEGDQIQVPLLLEECAQPPAAVALEVPLGILAAGRYQVSAVAGQVLGQGELEVLPATAILQNGRFEVAATWQTALGEEGEGRLVQPPSTDSALFYFFDRSNWELMVKVLDGCAINGHYWVFAAASTDVAFQVTVIEEGGRTFEIGNRLGQPAAAINSITAFSCQ